MELSQHLRAITLATPSAVSWMQVIWRPFLASVDAGNHTAQLNE